MPDAIPFNRSAPEAGRLEVLTPLVRRLVAGNVGPMTFTGTCTYVVGRGDVAVIDPGPDDPGHVERLLAALGGERISHIVVTHTHRDHSPAARPLAERTGAVIAGCGPHRAARPLGEDEVNPIDAAADHEHRPAIPLGDGETLSGAGWTLTAVATPGHTANHLAFALAEESGLFSGDHVMGWSTSVIAPPDGSMSDFMASLDKLKGRSESVYWPGHGGPVTEPQRFVRALAQHRRQREQAILSRLAAGDTAIPAIVAALYQTTPVALHGAAGLSVLAHLEDLCARGLVQCDDPVPQRSSRFVPA